MSTAAINILLPHSQTRYARSQSAPPCPGAWSFRILNRFPLPEKLRQAVQQEEGRQGRSGREASSSRRAHGGIPGNGGSEIPAQQYICTYPNHVHHSQQYYTIYPPPPPAAGLYRPPAPNSAQYGTLPMPPPAGAIGLGSSKHAAPGGAISNVPVQKQPLALAGQLSPPPLAGYPPYTYSAAPSYPPLVPNAVPPSGALLAYRYPYPSYPMPPPAPSAILKSQRALPVGPVDPPVPAPGSQPPTSHPSPSYVPQLAQRTHTTQPALLNTPQQPTSPKRGPSTSTSSKEASKSKLRDQGALSSPQPHPPELPVPQYYHPPYSYPLYPHPPPGPDPLRSSKIAAGSGKRPENAPTQLSIPAPPPPSQRRRPHRPVPPPPNRSLLPPPPATGQTSPSHQDPPLTNYPGTFPPVPAHQGYYSGQLPPYPCPYPYPPVHVPYAYLYPPPPFPIPTAQNAPTGAVSTGTADGENTDGESSRPRKRIKPPAVVAIVPQRRGRPPKKSTTVDAIVPVAGQSGVEERRSTPESTPETEGEGRSLSEAGSSSNYSPNPKKRPAPAPELERTRVQGSRQNARDGARSVPLAQVHRYPHPSAQTAWYVTAHDAASSLLCKQCVYSTTATIGTNTTAAYNIIIIDILGADFGFSFNYDVIFQLDTGFLGHGFGGKDNIDRERRW